MAQEKPTQVYRMTTVEGDTENGEEIHGRFGLQWATAQAESSRLNKKVYIYLQENNDPVTLYGVCTPQRFSR